MAEYPFNERFWPPAFEVGITEEEQHPDYWFAGNDKYLFQQLCEELNQLSTYYYEYLTQIRLAGIPLGSGPLLLKYLNQIEHEGFRAALLYRILADNRKTKTKIDNVDRLVLDLYYHFRASPYYVSPPKKPAPAHIYMEYNCELYRVKSKKILPELVELMKSLRDLYILSSVAKSIAKKWVPEELGKIMANHLINKNVTNADVGIPGEGDYKPNLESIFKQTRYTAIACLEYYPSEENIKVIMEYADNPDKDLAKFARESAEKMRKKLQEMQA
ncbi:MAG: hypothetical protein IKT54_03805 [Clostridia bacterium]|nr:hypothetical protein [Clostridia bacterium]